jgi:hypothetical protein
VRDGGCDVRWRWMGDRATGGRHRAGGWAWLRGGLEWPPMAGASRDGDSEPTEDTRAVPQPRSVCVQPRVMSPRVPGRASQTYEPIDSYQSTDHEQAEGCHL